MDLHLDEGDGVTAAEEITTADLTVAVVVRSVYVEEDMKAKAIKTGADEYLIKPYDQEELIKTIDRTLPPPL